MKKQPRKYPQLSACGLNCGLCPRYYTDGISRCPGCGSEDFYQKRLSCGALSCCLRQGYEYCYTCEEYPCKKYDGAELVDSFIIHKNIFENFEKVKEFGLENYQAELQEKIKILQLLLNDYNDGRRKSFFCTAVNLLELKDIKQIMEQIQAETNTDNTIKEKSAFAVHLFQAKADERNISLKLRKKA